MIYNPNICSQVKTSRISRKKKNGCIQSLAQTKGKPTAFSVCKQSLQKIYIELSGELCPCHSPVGAYCRRLANSIRKEGDVQCSKPRRTFEVVCVLFQYQLSSFLALFQGVHDKPPQRRNTWHCVVM